MLSVIKPGEGVVVVEAMIFSVTWVQAVAAAAAVEQA